jgi:hypothetical protein
MPSQESQTIHATHPAPQEGSPAAAAHPVPMNSEPTAMGAMGFLRRLIPKDLDTGDLLVIILLLLMAGDGKDSKNSALLTLALYLFL